MVRPTFLIAEPRPTEGISARKLVLETALFNVITAYDGPGAMALLDKFPNVDAVVVHTGLGETYYRQILDAAVASNPKRFTILLSPDGLVSHPSAHISLCSQDPKQLLDFLLKNFKLPPA